MANTRTPPPEAMEEVARQLGERLIVAGDQDRPRFSFESLNEIASPDDSTVRLGATFEVWRLSPIAVAQSRPPEAKLTKLARRVGWHHQVKLNDNSVGFARSSQAKLENGFSVDEIFVSEAEADAPDERVNLAEEINKAILWANEHIPDNKVAHLLTAPAYQIEALWFLDEEASEQTSDGDVYIVSLPPDNERLVAAKLMPAQFFLEALRNETPGMGVVHKQKRKR